MTLSVDDCLTAIRTHTEGLAAAAAGNLAARVEHCPDWSVADLVHHLTEVHHFWNHVATTLPSAPPEDRPEIERAPDDQLIDTMLTGMATLLGTLRAADQSAPCWTWGLEENVWFITRHQVQEAAVHHWDAANATGASWSMDDDAAIDAVDEFFTHSVANRRWPNPQAEPLGGTLWFCPCIADTDTCPTWHVSDGQTPGTVQVDVHPGVSPEIRGDQDGDHVYPPDLLLWLYRRVPDRAIASGGQPDGHPRPLLDRFRAFTNTD